MIQITYWLGSRVMTTELDAVTAIEAAKIIRQNGGKLVHYVAIDKAVAA